MHPDQHAKAAGWLILASGEAYEKTYYFSEWWQKEKHGDKEVNVRMSQTATLFIFREGNRWELWRATFRSGQSGPVSERVLRTGKDFKQIVDAGENFVFWWKNRKKDSPKAAQKRLAN